MSIVAAAASSCGSSERRLALRFKAATGAAGSSAGAPSVPGGYSGRQDLQRKVQAC